MAFIYLDNAASGIPNANLGRWYDELKDVYFVNPHGGTCFSEACRRLYLNAQRRLLSLLKIEDARVIFTSGVTEALTLAVASFDNVILAPGNHSAVIAAAKGKQSNSPALLCLNLINNETGEIADIEQLRRNHPNDFILADGAQALGKTDIRWNDGLDLLALSSRKIGGPPSVGALIVRKGIKLKPMIPGGGQQNGERGGTVDVIGIEIFVRTLEDVMSRREKSLQNVSMLAERLWKRLAEIDGVVRISPESATPFICMFSLPGYEGAVLSRLLAQKESIQISSSAACSAETGVLSPTLLAKGLDEKTIRGALRVSFSEHNTTDDVDAFIDALKRVTAEY